jgi:hypothetical protein
MRREDQISSGSQSFLEPEDGVAQSQCQLEEIGIELPFECWRWRALDSLRPFDSRPESYQQRRRKATGLLEIGAIIFWTTKQTKIEDTS